MINITNAENVWDKYWEENQYKNISLNDVVIKDAIYRLVKRLGFNKGGHNTIKLLENGCGTGIRSLSLVKDFSQIEFEITLVDISSVALAVSKRISRENNLTNVHYVRADILSLPFPDKQFDLVWNEGVNEHMKGKDRLKVFWEMYRVTKKGGKMVVIVPNRLNFAYRLHKKLRELRQEWQYGYENPFTIFELKDIMKTIGFKEFTTSGSNVIIGYIWLMKYLIGILIHKKFNIINVVKNASLITKKNSVREYIERLDIFAEQVKGSVLGRDIGIAGLK